MKSNTMYAHPNISPYLLSHNGAVVQLQSSILGLVGSSPTHGKLFFSSLIALFHISRYFSYFCSKICNIHISILASDGQNYLEFYLTFRITHNAQNI